MKEVSIEELLPVHSHKDERNYKDTFSFLKERWEKDFKARVNPVLEVNQVTDSLAPPQNISPARGAAVRALQNIGHSTR